MSRPWLVVVVAVIAAATACGVSSRGAATKRSTSNRGSDYVQQLALAHLPPCPPSSTSAVAGGLPALTLSCLGKGPAVHLAGLTGRPTVVNLWGSWCGPCQIEAAYLSSTYDQVRGRVRFLGVDIEDTDDSALNFGTKVTPPVRYPSVVDPDKSVLNALHFTGPPETLFLDASGRVVHTQHGEYTSGAALRSDLSTYLHVHA
jgi:cytochrome c biogenesis protein CcmG, thiol:disulfide interchange protein DsbE